MRSKWPTTVALFVDEHRTRFVLGIIAVNVIWVQAVCAQRLYSTFSQIVDRPLGFLPAGLSVHAAQRGTYAEIAVYAQRAQSLHLFRFTDSASIEPAGVIVLRSAPLEVVSADLPGHTEYVALTDAGKSVTLLERRAREWKTQVLQGTENAQHLMVTDIDDNGVKDILLYGKGMTGVATLLGDRKGGYRSGPVLFSDISVSDIKVTDINGDGIEDVILCNWLSNRLSIFYGISGMVFSEQVTVDLPGEPSSVDFAWTDRHRRLALAVTLPGEDRIVILHARPDGDIRLDQTLLLPAGPRRVEFARIDDDLLADFVATTDKGMAVSLGSGPMEYLPPVMIGAGSGTLHFSLADVDGDRKNDLVVADGESQRLICMANSAHGSHAPWPPRYAVGSKPGGVAVADVNGDGLPDIVVANANSSSISLLLNRGKGQFLGQQALWVAEQPSEIVVPKSGDGIVHGLVSSHNLSDQIGIVSLDFSTHHASSFSVPTGPHPYVLQAWQRPGALTVLVRNREKEGRGATLSLFEQIGGRQFLERSLRTTSPQQMVTVAVEQLSDSDLYRVAFAKVDEAARTSTVSYAVVDHSFSVRSVTPVLTFNDSTGSLRSLIPATLSSGIRRDMIVVLGKPMNALLLVFGNGMGTPGVSTQWIYNITIADDRDLIVYDVNGDGFPDLTIRNQATGAIETVFGDKDGFNRRKVICSANGIGGIAVARLVTPGAPDLVLTHPDEAAVSVLFSPFSDSP